MLWCADPLLNYLNAFGYCVVRLPKMDVRPLQIYTKRGNSLDRLGELATILLAGDAVPFPPISENIQAATISGKRTGDISIGVGLSIMDGILSAMGGLKLGLDARFREAKTISFEFHSVLEDKVELAKLDQYLNNADVNPYSRYVTELLEADRLYVTTATLKSQKFVAEARKSDGTSLEVPLPEIQGMVGGNVNVSGQANSTSRITFEGSHPLVFGFQAIQLFYQQGHYRSFEPLPEGVPMRGGAASRGPVRQLEVDAPFVRLN